MSIVTKKNYNFINTERHMYLFTLAVTQGDNRGLIGIDLEDFLRRIMQLLEGKSHLGI